MSISVALCSYNGERYIEKQLLSILNQEVGVDEIVICDDGSNDSTITIVRQLSEAHPEVKWRIEVNHPNLGVTFNFEKAIKLCEGDFIFLSDQDDLWKANKTKLILQYFTKNEERQVVFTDAELIDGDGHILSNYSLLDAVGLLPNMSLWNAGLELEILKRVNRATGATMAFRKEFKSKILPFSRDAVALHDEQMAVTASLFGALGVMAEKLISYRQHGNNVIGVSPNNWIYTHTAPPNLLAEIVEPLPFNDDWAKYISSSSKLKFYQFRLNNYSSIKGKIRLLFSVFDYKRNYTQYWAAFFLSDFLYGISSTLRQKMLSYMNVAKRV